MCNSYLVQFLVLDHQVRICTTGENAKGKNDNFTLSRSDSKKANGGTTGLYCVYMYLLQVSSAQSWISHTPYDSSPVAHRDCRISFKLKLE